MLQTTEAESRQEAARPHFIRALETTLDIQRAKLLGELSRSTSPWETEILKDKARDFARFITNGLQPLIDHWHREGLDEKIKFRAQRITDALYDAAHPNSPLPHSPLRESDLTEALVALATKIDALAIGVELILRKEAK